MAERHFKREKMLKVVASAPLTSNIVCFFFVVFFIEPIYVVVVLL